MRHSRVMLGHKYGAIRRGILRQLDSNKSVPYCHIYSLSGPFVPPDKFDAASYAGLIAWHLAANASGAELVSYWQDKFYYRYNRSRFEGALHLTGARGWGGGVGDLHAKNPTWWPSNIKEALIGLSALLGALTVIWTTLGPIGEALLTTPRAEVSFAVPKADVNEGDTTSVSVTARNATGIIPIDLTASAVLKGGTGSSEPVPLDPSFYATIPANAAETLTAQIKAPPLNRQNSPHPVYEDYKLSIAASARTWRFQPATAAQAAELPVRVWPRSFGWTPKLKQTVEKDPTVYNGSGTLSSGKVFAAGLIGTITVGAPEAVDLDINMLAPFQKLPQQPEPSPPAGGMRTIQVDFSSPPLEKNREYPYQVTMTTKSGSAPRGGWDGISVQIFFRERAGG